MSVNANIKSSSMWGTLVLLIIAGEIIFALPFHLTRFFRPTFLSVYELTNTELGDMFAVYGLVAMLSYFPGGMIADRLPAKPLMTLSLVATAMGGLYLLTRPDSFGLTCLFGYWGLTTILLFWSAMLKSIRLNAQPTQQGKAFGFLDGGRGFIASLFASIAVLLFALYIPSDDQAEQTLQVQQQGMFAVVLFYTGITLSAALLLALFWRPAETNSEQTAQLPKTKPSNLFNNLSITASNPLVWLQAAIVVCAYCGYKALDNYGVLVTDALGWTQLESSQLTGALSYSRPVAAIIAGICADRWRASKLVALLFFTALISFAVCALLLGFMASNNASSLTSLLIVLNLLITALAVFALRAVYFALLEESRLALSRTGTAIGLISFIGYTPDIFFASVTGRMLDAGTISDGFTAYFWLMSIISLVGLTLSLLLSRKLKTVPSP